MKILVISYKKPSEIVLKKLFLNNLTKKTKVTFVTYENYISSGYTTNKLKKKFFNIKFYSVKNLVDLKLIIDKFNPKFVINYFIENFNQEFENLYFFVKKFNIPIVKIIEHPFTWDLYLKRIKFKLSKKKYIYDHGILCSNFAEHSHRYHFYKNKHFFCNMNYISYYTNKKKILKDKKSNLFIDENFVNHPDVKIHKLKNFPSPKKYYSQLISFFSFIKKKLNQKIDIAAHPTTLKKNFGDNPVIFNNTFKLVKKAKLIILHQSSAIDYAILAKKDLLFITSNEINRLAEGMIINKIANFFNTKPLNLSKKYDVALINKRIASFSKNKKLYKKFIKEFIKHPNFNKFHTIDKIYSKISRYNKY